MKIRELLPPERVREIAVSYGPPFGSMVDMREDAINAASPEIARAVLMDAARQLGRRGLGASCALVRQMADEIEP